MNWSRAKNLILVSLIILNLFLFGMIYLNSYQYKISNEQDESIHNLLEDNNIFLYTNLVKEFKPKSQLFSEELNLNEDAYVNLLFPNNDDVVVSVAFDSALYSKTTESTTENVQISPSNLVYTKETKEISKNTISQEIAKEFTDNFILKAGELFNGFNFDKIIKTDKGYIIEYRQTLNGYLIYSNYLIFNVNDNGIYFLELKQDKLLYFDDKQMDICSSDEALLTLMTDIKENQFKYRKGDESIFITKIDLVYYNPQNSQNTSTFNQVPCYRIYLQSQSKPILINAYYNTIAE